MDYAARIISGRQPRPMRNVIYGVEKIGKSEFAAQFPNPVTLAAEDGTSHIDTNRIVPISWEDAIGFMQYLYETPNHGYATLNIDTIGWIEQMAVAAILKRFNVDSLELVDGGYGKWKRILMDECENLLNWTTALYTQGMHINFIGHAQVTKFKNPEDIDYDRYQLAVATPLLGERVKQWADNVLFMNYDTIFSEKKEGMAKKKQAVSLNHRIMHCQRSAAFDAGNRMNLPDKINLGESPQEGFAKFAAFYDAWLTQNTQPAAAAAS